MTSTRHKRTLRIRGDRVTVSERGKKTTYQYRVFPADPELGEAGVHLEKLDGQSYDVLVGPMPSCECLGHLRWSCEYKHIRITKVLVERERSNETAGRKTTEQ